MGFCTFDYIILEFVGTLKTVWVVGSSIIKDAFIEARTRPGGINLGLQQQNVSIWWQGRSGMVVGQLKQQIKKMLTFEDPPSVLVIHLAGNDIGRFKIGHLRNEIKSIMTWLQQELPNTLLVWSQILPRNNWRYSESPKAMEKCRYRLNNSIATFVLNLGGGYIRYPEILSDKNLIGSDGVHLTTLGTNILLNTLRGGLDHFIYRNGNVFPAI